MKQTTLFGPTLQEARLELLSKIDEGTVCPCCGRYAKRYRRKLNSNMARALVWLYKRNEYEWFNLEKEMRALIAAHPSTPRSGDPAKLKHWGMLEVASKDNKSSPGEYRLTNFAVAFIQGKMIAARYCYIFSDKSELFEGSTTIREALGDHFDYDELMGHIG